jgi:uncharacterized membrane protein
MNYLRYIVYVNFKKMIKMIKQAGKEQAIHRWTNSELFVKLNTIRTYTKLINREKTDQVSKKWKSRATDSGKNQLVV